MIRDAETWRLLGDAARLAHEAVQSAFRDHVRERDPGRYYGLLSDFRRKTAAALPSSDAGFFNALAKGNGRAIDTAITFLEADAWFFRSGYEKQNLIRHLKRARLTSAQKDRLGKVVVNAIDGRDRQEFRHYGRLACGVWTDALDEEVARRMRSSDPGVRRRATWVAEAVLSAGKA